jgi:cytochrome c oxidase subunit 2
MDAVPGLPTYFIFTPTKTTKEWRKDLSKYEEYQMLDEDGVPYWKTADYELACAELCGTGHWTMKKTVRIVEEDEYEEWLAEQESYYLANIRGEDEDPHGDILFPAEIEARSAEFNNEANTALDTPDDADNTLILKHVTFKTGSAELTDLSRYQLDDAIAFLKKNVDVSSLLKGHTDNVGNPDSNLSLSQTRAKSVYDYLVKGGVDAERLSSTGYGSAAPREINDTAEGRQANRRTELYITKDELPAVITLSK